jgi:acyl-CoA synthetase (AMP-forming)/AMP-acid ligase II
MASQAVKSTDPILARWQETLREHARRPALFDCQGGVSRTFLEIDREAEEWAVKLENIAGGAVLGLQIGNHPSWPALFLACLRRGLPVLPLETTITKNERTAALDLTGAEGFFTADANGRIALNPTETQNGLRQPADCSLLKLTSGTTAAPRAIRFRSSQLLADCDQICETMGIGADDLNYGVIPISHSYGFSNLLTPLLARGVSMVVTGDRLPRAVLNGLEKTGATVFPGMPVFYQAFCACDDLPDLSSLRLCISAGAPLSAVLAWEFRQKFGQSIHSFYGSSECGGICYDKEAKDFVDGFVGSPMTGVSLELIEPDAESTQIEVRSNAVADGYFPELSPDKLGNGVFRPDDLLERAGSGFRIAGRVSDLINVAGKKMNPAEVETHLLSIEGVRQAVVFSRPSTLRNEEIAACVVADDNVDEAALLRSCRTHLNGWKIPRRIFLVPEIPVNERGKTSRRQLAELFTS